MVEQLWLQLLIAIVTIVVAQAILGGLSRSAPEKQNQHGFELVNKIEADTEDKNRLQPTVDIIFVHGLGSKRDRAWTWRASKSSSQPVNWVTELLPDDIRSFLAKKGKGTIRLFLYGYNSVWASNAPVVDLQTLAEGLVNDLQIHADEFGSDNSRLIFVAHSHGGLVVKQALATDRANTAARTDGVIFLGTPHYGADISWLAEIVSLGLKPWGSQSGLLISLRRESEILSNLRTNFSAMLTEREKSGSARMALFNFVENLETKVFDLGLNMRYTVLVVPQSSAKIEAVGWQTIYLNRDHKQLNKFSDRDAEYKKLLLAIKKCAELAITQPSAPGYRKQQSEEQIKCLQSLSFPAMDARQRDIPTAHSGTCQWLYATPEFKKWLSPNREEFPLQEDLLWVKGLAGAGKSTIMKNIFFFCKDGPLKHSLIAVYFYNARGYPLERTILGMLRSLIYQIISRDDSSFKRLFSRYIDNQTKHGDSWEWSLAQLKEFLLSEMSEARQMELCFFVDALDECDEDEAIPVVELFRSMSQHALKAGHRMRMCFASRHTPVLSLDKNLEIILEQNSEHQKSIRSYIRATLEVKNSSIESKLISKSNGVFLWAALAIAKVNRFQLRGIDIWQMEAELQRLPSEVESLYKELFQPGDISPEAVLIFQWVLFTKSPLEVAQLYFAVQAGAHPENLRAWDPLKIDLDAMFRNVQSFSKGLVELRESGTSERRTKSAQTLQEFHLQLTQDSNLNYLHVFPPNVQFIHQTVNDFLTEDGRLGQLDPRLAPEVVGLSYDRMAKCCFNYIRMVLDSEKLPGWQANRDELFPFLDHASEHILIYAEDAERNGVSQAAFVTDLVESGRWVRLAHMVNRTENSPNPKLDPSLLHELSCRGHGSLLQLLLESSSGIDINAESGARGTALLTAAYSKEARSKDCVRILLLYGADPNTEGGRLGNALQAASSVTAHDNADIVRMLLEAGANVNTRGGQFGTALNAALFTYRGWRRTLDLLLDAGADVHISNPAYGNALQAAAANIKPVEEDICWRLFDQMQGLNFGPWKHAITNAAFNQNSRFVEILLAVGKGFKGAYEVKLELLESQAQYRGPKQDKLEDQERMIGMLIENETYVEDVKDPKARERLLELGFIRQADVAEGSQTYIDKSTHAGRTRSAYAGGVSSL